MALVCFETKTGEVLNDVVIKTKKQVEREKKAMEAKEKYRIVGSQFKEDYKEYGTFVWFLYNADKVLELGISNEDLTKLIFISTYLDYKNNRLMSDENSCMTKKEMQKLLKVSEVTFWRFFKSVTDTKILYENNGIIYLNRKLFSRGAMENIKDIDKNRTRLYTKGIRCLYEKARIYEHSLLSYLYQAIPFVNIQYNMLCFNPLETDIKHINPMLFEEYCKKIGYGSDNVRRLKAKIKPLRLEGQPVFNFVDNTDGLFCYINPNVYYAGNNFKEVRILGEFVKK